MKKVLLSVASIALIASLTVACSNEEAMPEETQNQEQTATPLDTDSGGGTDENTGGTTNADSSGNAGDEAGEEVTVLIDENSMFNMSELHIKNGTKVTWVNNDSIAHTVYETNNLFNSENMVQGSTFSYTFDQPGTYTYYCSIHPSMEAEVIVE